jgi:hypothetical protein
MVIDRAPAMETMPDAMLTIPTLPVEQYELSLPDQVSPPSETRMLAMAMLLSLLMFIMAFVALVRLVQMF